MTQIYQKIYSIAFVAILPFLLLRLFSKNSSYRKKWWQRLGIVKQMQHSKPLIWIHAVSVGEVKVTEPLINHLRMSHPNEYTYLVTTTTPGGAEQLARQFQGDIEHLFFPYDVSLCLKKFIRQVRPQVLMIIETELWPNLFALCKQENIPVLLINGRLSLRSYQRYLKFGLPKLKLFDNVDFLSVQTQADAERFIQLGMQQSRTTVTGSLKFDISGQSKQASSLLGDFTSLKNRLVWIAASTHPGEEEYVLNAHQDLLEHFPEALLILAPRHPDRCNAINQRIIDLNMSVSLRSVDTTPDFQDQVFLLDTLGELADIFEVADLCFMGGSLIDHGGQNPLEAIEKNAAIMVGGNTRNFYLIYQQLVEERAAVRVQSQEELKTTLLDLFNDNEKRRVMTENAREYLEKNRGNTHRLVEEIAAYLP